MTHAIPYENWPGALADAIDRATDGDTILCHGEAMVERSWAAWEEADSDGP